MPVVKNSGTGTENAGNSKPAVLSAANQNLNFFLLIFIGWVILYITPRIPDSTNYPQTFLQKSDSIIKKEFRYSICNF